MVNVGLVGLGGNSAFQGRRYPTSLISLSGVVALLCTAQRQFPCANIVSESSESDRGMKARGPRI